MERLSAYGATWKGRALHLQTSRGEQLVIEPERLTLGSEPSLRPEDLGVLRFVTRSRSTMELSPKAWLDLSGDFSEAYELRRVLSCWRDDPAVREAWGTPALDALLIPDLDEARVRKLNGVLTAHGIELPALGAMPIGTRFGCLGLLAAGPGWLLAMHLSVENGETTGGKYGWVAAWAFLTFFVLPVGTWLLHQKLPQDQKEHRAIIGQHGLTLPGGALLPYNALRRARAVSRDTIELTTEEGEKHLLNGVRGEQAPVLAAILDARRVQESPREIPQAIRALRRDREPQ